MELEILQTLDEQIVSGFSGKINLMESNTSQILGCFYLHRGELINAKYRGSEGLKAFYSACIDGQSSGIKCVVEAEIVDLREKKIHSPLSVLRRRLVEVADKTAQAQDSRPPDNLKLLINPSIMHSDSNVERIEFSVLCTLSDYNKVSDVYKFNPMLDYEITNALVSLRQKGAIKVVADN